MNTDMNRWLPCQSACEMSGSACFFLSISDIAVLIHGPRWCSTIAAGEMANIEKKYEKRFFCSEIKQSDLVFGAAEEIGKALEEVRQEMTPEMIAVMTSCSMSLIGDDLEGICKSHNVGCPVLTMDSGGLRGEFLTGYERACLNLLKQTDPEKDIQKDPKTVNIIGWCSAYPQSQGDLKEIRRLLEKTGISCHLILGSDSTKMETIKSMGRASLNLVLYPELGLKAAKMIEEKWQIPYAVLPVPYGPAGTKTWLSAVCEKLGITPDMTAINEEISYRREKIDLATFRLKQNNRHLLFGDVYAHLTYGTACGLIPALQKEFPELNHIYLRLEGPGDVNSISGIIPWIPYSPIHMEEDEIALSLGNTYTRQETGHFHKTIYKNFLFPHVNLQIPEKCYAGLKGWQIFLSEVYNDFYTLAYMNGRTPQSQPFDNFATETDDFGC